MIESGTPGAESLLPLHPKKPKYSPLYERLVSKEKYDLLAPVSSISPGGSARHKFVPRAEPLTSSHRLNDIPWSKLLSQSSLPERQFVTGGINGGLSFQVDSNVASGGLSKRIDSLTVTASPMDPEFLVEDTASPTQHETHAQLFDLAPLSDHDLSTRTLSSNSPHLRSLYRLKGADIRESSYSELAANVAYFSQSVTLTPENAQSLQSPASGSAPFDLDGSPSPLEDPDVASDKTYPNTVPVPKPVPKASNSRRSQSRRRRTISISSQTSYPQAVCRVCHQRVVSLTRSPNWASETICEQCGYNNEDDTPRKRRYSREGRAISERKRM